MDKAKLRSLLTTTDTTIKEAMKKLNDTAGGVGGKILFVVNEAEKLLGTVTDGDIRRGIIKEYGFSDRIKGLTKWEFFFVSSNVPNKEYYAKRVMIENKIEQIPILDTKDTIVDVVMWTDILEHKERK